MEAGDIQKKNQRKKYNNREEEEDEEEMSIFYIPESLLIFSEKKWSKKENDSLCRSKQFSTKHFSRGRANFSVSVD